ncbi:hypothetical protein BJV74DRAFT_400130 [Russula compacta]|nr:hypothetical protein BJV74DRAFT_400130 [Russula compacta]
MRRLVFYIGIDKGRRREVKGPFTHGTWQFISIARLLDPLCGLHEVSDDLESFFWVLLYLVVKYRNTTGVNHSESMRLVFDYHTDMDRHGNVTGGRWKLACVRDVLLAPPTVHSLVETPCGDIIEELRTLFCDFYCHVSADPILSTHSRLSRQAKREQDPQVKDARKRLNSSEWILDMMDRHLASKWDVADDGSLLKTELHPDRSARRHCRKRKVPDDGLTFNASAKGDCHRVYQCRRVMPLRRKATEPSVL